MITNPAEDRFERKIEAPISGSKCPRQNASLCSLCSDDCLSLKVGQRAYVRHVATRIITRNEITWILRWSYEQLSTVQTVTSPIPACRLLLPLLQALRAHSVRMSSRRLWQKERFRRLWASLAETMSLLMQPPSRDENQTLCLSSLPMSGFVLIRIRYGNYHSRTHAQAAPEDPQRSILGSRS